MKCFSKKSTDQDENFDLHDKLRYVVAKLTPEKIRETYRNSGYSPIISLTHPLSARHPFAKALDSIEWGDKLKLAKDYEDNVVNNLDNLSKAILLLDRYQKTKFSRLGNDRDAPEGYAHNKTQLDMFNYVDGLIDKSTYLKRKKARYSNLHRDSKEYNPMSNLEKARNICEDILKNSNKED